MYDMCRDAWQIWRWHPYTDPGHSDSTLYSRVHIMLITYTYWWVQKSAIDYCSMLSILELIATPKGQYILTQDPEFNILYYLWS